MSSQDDIAILQAIGTDILREFVCVVIETCLVVIYSILVIKASRILLNKHRRRNPLSIVMLVIVLTMYFLDIALWMIDIHNIITELSMTLTSSKGGSLEDRYAASGNILLRLALVEDVVFAYMTLLGDAIVLWRVYAFYSNDIREKLVMILPLSVYLASIILSGLVAFCAAKSDTNITLGAFSNPAFCRNIQWTSYFVQMGTAAVATLLVAFKTWKYRRLVKSYLGQTNVDRSPVNGAMMIIVDTGVIYTLWLCIEAIIPGLKQAAAENTVLSFAMEIYEYTASSVVGIYPTVVVILIHTYASFLDSCSNTHVSTMAFHHSHTRPTQTFISTQMMEGGETTSTVAEVTSKKGPIIRPALSGNDQESFGSRVNRSQSFNDIKAPDLEESEHAL